MSASHVHVMFALSDTEPLTPARRMREGKGAARQPGGLQSQSLLAHTSCFFLAGMSRHLGDPAAHAAFQDPSSSKRSVWIRKFI